MGTDLRQAFDMRDAVARIVDGSRFREFKKEYGTTIVTVSPATVWFVFCLSHTSLLATGLCTHSWLSSRNRGQQWHPVLAIGAQGDAFHRALLSAADTPTLPGERHGIHGWVEGGEGRYREGWREDGSRGRLRGRTQAHCGRRWELRGWELRYEMRLLLIVNPRLTAL